MSNCSTLTKPEKPYSEFPLFFHGSGRYAKKILGRLHYFGRWAEPHTISWQDALKLYSKAADDLHAGKKSKASQEEESSPTVRYICDEYVDYLEAQVATGELAPQTLMGYRRAVDMLVDELGDCLVADLRPADFAKVRARLASTNGLVSLGNRLTWMRMVFSYAWNERLISQPVRFGKSFAAPKRRILLQDKRNRARANGGGCSFTAEEVRAVLSACDPLWRAMTMLGVGNGLEPHDLGQLRFDHLDLDTGWLTFARPKTQQDRRSRLMPETVQAIKEWLSVRPEPLNKADRDLVFLKPDGRSWYRADQPSSKFCDHFVRKILEPLGLKRRGRAFLALRHMTATIGGQALDEVALRLIMGHADQSMTATYREHVGDERLERVSDTIRGWLFPNIANYGTMQEPIDQYQTRCEACP